MNLEPPVALGYWHGVQKISMIMIHFADVVFWKILTQISIDFRNHQSLNWFNNFVMLPPISNDLDKKHFKKYTFWQIHCYVIDSLPPAGGLLNYAQLHPIKSEMNKRYHDLMTKNKNTTRCDENKLYHIEEVCRYPLMITSCSEGHPISW